MPKKVDTYHIDGTVHQCFHVDAVERVRKHPAEWSLSPFSEEKTKAYQKDAGKRAEERKATLISEGREKAPETVHVAGAAPAAADDKAEKVAAAKLEAAEKAKADAEAKAEKEAKEAAAAKKELEDAKAELEALKKTNADKDADKGSDGKSDAGKGGKSS